jgi:hypothetical protein
MNLAHPCGSSIDNEVIVFVDQLSDKKWGGVCDGEQ